MDKLRHLQSVILDIIKDIDELCIANDIDYYLLGGSAIGAIRHKGFIPWDDDLDIIMTNENYHRFIQISKQKLDKDKYYIQEGLKDWPLYFTKVRLKGTHLNELEKCGDEQSDGIYVDVFKMDNVSSNKAIALWQYFCAKVYLCYQLSVRTYDSASLKKHLMISFSFPLKCGLIRRFVINQVESYNKSDTKYYGFFYGRTKLKNSITARSIYGKPVRVPFEDTYLPIQEYCHDYLTQMFGNYMELPPEDKRVGLHLIDVDFGKY